MISRFLAVLLCALFVLSTVVSAQEMGRAPLEEQPAKVKKETSGPGLGRAALPKAEVVGSMGPGLFGVGAEIGWTSLKFDIGDRDGSDNVWAPEANFFYMVTDCLDIRLGVKYASGEDEADNRTIKGSFTRISLGAQYWLDTKTVFIPYAGASIGYYLVNADVGDDDADPDNRPGFSLRGGCAFQISDNFQMTAGLSYDGLLGKADATVNNQSEDFSISALSISLGATVLF